MPQVAEWKLLEGMAELVMGDVTTLTDTWLSFALGLMGINTAQPSRRRF